MAALDKEKGRLYKIAEEAEPRSTHLKLKMAVSEAMGAKQVHQHVHSSKHLRLENEKLKRMVKCTDVQELQNENRGTVLS